MNHSLVLLYPFGRIINGLVYLAFKVVCGLWCMTDQLCRGVCVCACTCTLSVLALAASHQKHNSDRVRKSLWRSNNQSSMPLSRSHTGNQALTETVHTRLKTQQLPQVILSSLLYNLLLANWIVYLYLKTKAKLQVEILSQAFSGLAVINSICMLLKYFEIWLFSRKSKNISGVSNTGPSGGHLSGKPSLRMN